MSRWLTATTARRRPAKDPSLGHSALKPISELPFVLRCQGEGSPDGAIFSSNGSDADPWFSCARGCGGRSNQSGSGGGGAAAVTGGRGVPESRIVPDDRDLPGGYCLGWRI